MIVLECEEYTQVLEKLVFKSKEITDALKSGYCAFEYVKKRGEFRPAFGTLLPSFIKKHAKLSGLPSTDKRMRGINAAKLMGYIQYFDLEQGTWRQFMIRPGEVNLIKKYDTLQELSDDYPAYVEFDDYK